jgi:hypothetical protein
VRNIRRKSEFIHQEIESEKTDSGTSTEISEDEVDLTLNISKNSKTPINKKSKLSNIKRSNTVSQEKKNFFIQENWKTHDINVLNMPEFNEHIPKNGGFFEFEKKIIKYINTCTIDYFLFAFWVLSKLIPMFKERIPNRLHKNDIIKIIESIENLMWDNARKIWFLEIMKGKIPKNNSVNFFGEIQVFFLQHINHFQSHTLLQNCTKSCILNGKTISQNSNIIQLAKLRNNEVKIISNLANKCSACNNRVVCDLIFNDVPVFVFMEAFSHFKIDEIPRIYEIQKKNYKLLSMILHLKAENHFVSVFDIADKKYVVDDLLDEAILFN